MDEQQKEKIAKQVFTYLKRLESSNWVERWSAAYRVGELRHPAAVDPLIKALSDKDADVRRVALEALGKIGDSRSVPHILKSLKSRDKEMRLSAIRALGNMKDEATSRALIEFLKDVSPEDLDLRKFIIHRLGELEAEEAVDSILELLGDEVMESYCVRALSKIGEKAVPRLLERLKGDDLHRANLACQALGRIRCFEAVDEIKRLLHHADPNLRAEALRALARIADKPAQAALKEILEGGGPMATEAAIHLKRLGDADAEAFLRARAEERTIET